MFNNVCFLAHRERSAIVVVLEGTVTAHELAIVGADELDFLVGVVGAGERGFAQFGFFVEFDCLVLLVDVDFVLTFARRTGDGALVGLGVASGGWGLELTVPTLEANEMIARKLTGELAVVVERLPAGMAI